MSTTIFGSDVKAKLFIPKSSAEWSIDGIFGKSDYDNVLLLSFELTDEEIVDIRRCFEETTHIFAFGRNPQTSILHVSTVIFLYDGCGDSEHGNWLKLQELRDKYKACRVYEKNAPIKVRIDDFVLNGFLIKLHVSDVDPVKKLCVATFTFLLDQEV